MRRTGVVGWTLAAPALAVIGVFFVLPVSGMLALGFWPEGTFDPAGVAEVRQSPRVHRVLWFTLWSAWSLVIRWPPFVSLGVCTRNPSPRQGG